MNGNEIRHQIAAALAGLAEKPLSDAAGDYFAALGYHSQRRLTFASHAECLTQHVFATKQGGFYDVEPRYSCQWPITSRCLWRRPLGLTPDKEE